MHGSLHPAVVAAAAAQMAQAQQMAAWQQAACGMQSGARSGGSSHMVAFSAPTMLPYGPGAAMPSSPFFSMQPPMMSMYGLSPGQHAHAMPSLGYPPQPAGTMVYPAPMQLPASMASPFGAAPSPFSTCAPAQPQPGSLPSIHLGADSTPTNAAAPPQSGSAPTATTNPGSQPGQWRYLVPSLHALGPQATPTAQQSAHAQMMMASCAAQLAPPPSGSAGALPGMMAATMWGPAQVAAYSQTHGWPTSMTSVMASGSTHTLFPPSAQPAPYDHNTAQMLAAQYSAQFPTMNPYSCMPFAGSAVWSTTPAAASRSSGGTAPAPAAPAPQ
jgi:hypothetical protein